MRRKSRLFILPHYHGSSLMNHFSRGCGHHAFNMYCFLELFLQKAVHLFCYDSNILPSIASSVRSKIVMLRNSWSAARLDKILELQHMSARTPTHPTIQALIDKPPLLPLSRGRYEGQDLHCKTRRTCFVLTGSIRCKTSILTNLEACYMLPVRE